MEYAIIWTLDGCQYHQAFDTLDAAADKLTEWADTFPHNTYYLTRIIGYLPSSQPIVRSEPDAKLHDAYAKFNEITRKAYRHGQQYQAYSNYIPQIYADNIPD